MSRFTFVAAYLLYLWVHPVVSLAQEADEVINEDQIKTSIERVARDVICTDEARLASAGVDFEKCESGAARFADSCWESIDKVVDNYELPAKDESQATYESIATVYVHCVQANLYGLWVGRKNSGQ